MDGWVTGCVCFRIRTLLEVFGMHQEEICIHKYVFYKYICKGTLVSKRPEAEFLDVIVIKLI
jgi:hypothetical protein